MQEENFSPQASLALIQSMIAKTRQGISDNSVHFLIWGWVTFVACIGQFILKNMLDYEQHYLVWLLVFPASIASFYLGMKQNKKREATTYVGESMQYLWMGMGIGYFVLSMILTRLGWNTTIYPFFMLLYGLGTFISGKLLEFKPLVYGGLMAWALAIGSTFFNYDYQILFGAAAILVSYIIPSYLLKIKVNKKNDTP